MDSSDDDAAATAMAETMGFSSFGAQGSSNKRRKYNPNADNAVVASSSSGALPLHHDRGGGRGPASSGSNNTPLGARRAPPFVNSDEIALDEDEDEEDVDAGARLDPAAEDGSDPEPQYIDTSRPSAPGPAVVGAPPTLDGLAGVSSSGYQAHAPAPVGGGHGGRRSGRPIGHQWWDDYYDPSVNVNPWEKLEKQLGLQPRGPWLSWEESKGKWEEMSAKVAT